METEKPVYASRFKLALLVVSTLGTVAAGLVYGPEGVMVALLLFILLVLVDLNAKAP